MRLVRAFVIDQDKDVDVVDLHPQLLGDLRRDIHPEESVGEATAEIGIDEVRVDGSKCFKEQVLSDFARQMLGQECSGGIDLLERLIDQSIMRRLNPFIAMLFIERVHKR